MALKLLKFNDSEARGRELRQISICVSKLLNSSKLKVQSRKTASKCFLTDLTPDSYRPLKWESCGGIKCQRISVADEHLIRRPSLVCTKL